MDKRCPAFQLYPRDFLSSMKVQAMTVEEIGGYVLLLMYSWIAEEQCYLPHDPELLRKACRMSPEQWARHSPAILACFETTVDDDKLLVNHRLLQVRMAQDLYRAKQTRAGKAGARKRWRPDSTAIAPPSQCHSKPMADDSSSSSSASASSPSPSAQGSRARARCKVDDGLVRHLEKLSEEWSQIPGVQPSLLVSSDMLDDYAERALEPGWLEKLPEALSRIRSDALYRGQNRDNWRASLGWLLKAGSVRRVLEDGYESWRLRPEDDPDAIFKRPGKKEAPENGE